MLCSFYIFCNLAVTKYISYKVGDSCASLNVTDISLSDEIILYPNPVKNKLFIVSNSVDISKVEIYSALGSLVKKVTRNFNSIQLEDLSKGLYLVKIYTDKIAITKKFIKQ